MAGRNKKKFAVLSALLLFFAACSREIPYTIVLQGEERSLGEEAAKIAEEFFVERNGETDPEIKINSDGSASVFLDYPGAGRTTARKTNQKEIFRIFYFEDEDWIALLPQGFYTTKPGFESDRAVSNAVSLLLIKTKKEQFLLSQFAAWFYRPDLVDGFVRGYAEIHGEKTELPWTISSLLRAKKRPPELLSLEVSGSRISAKVKTNEEGGALAVWGTITGNASTDESPELLAVVDLEKNADSKYRERGKTVYEVFADVPVNFQGGSIGVSAFDRERTLESERRWAEGPSLQAGVLASISGGGGPPDLHVLFSGEKTTEHITGLFAAQEKNAGLYSRVVIHHAENNAGAVNRKFDDLSGEIKEKDVFVFFLSAESSMSLLGDYVFFAGDSENADSWSITENFLKLEPRRTILFLDAQGMDPALQKTAFARLGRFLGTRSAVANYSFTNIPDGKFEIPFSGNRYLSADEFIAAVQDNSSPTAGRARFFPGGDYPFLDTYTGYGEIKMQTMYSGVVNISGPPSYSATSSSLTFGETLTRRLPAGQYTVTMTYRNGRRETRTANVAYNSSLWVTFSYVPELLEGNFSRLPSFGVNIGELNPANYRGADPQVLRAMEVPAWQISFLAGEEFYRRARYRDAITEYTRSISSRNDYYPAYVSRGNAYRRTGESARAIDDYTRALRIKPDYAEVYNYRGYLYSQNRDFARAVGDYSQAIRHRANYADALFNRAYAYGRQSLWDEAIGDYSQVIRLEPNNAAAYTERGRARQNKGDSAGAGADFDRAEALKKNL